MYVRDSRCEGRLEKHGKRRQGEGGGGEGDENRKGKGGKKEIALDLCSPARAPHFVFKQVAFKQIRSCLCGSCAHTLLIAFVSPRRASVTGAPGDGQLGGWHRQMKKSSEAIHSSEKQLSPSLSLTPWACMRMSPGPCLNAWHPLQTATQTAAEESPTHANTHTVRYALKECNLI